MQQVLEYIEARIIEIQTSDIPVTPKELISRLDELDRLKQFIDNQ